MYEEKFTLAKKRFQQYLNGYDTTDPKIHLKVVHTFGVVKAAEFLANALSLSEEDTYVCRCIALLHDIGRFEQLRRYHSFDDAIMPHAQCSVDILFGEGGLIREFVPDPKWDPILQQAIAYHGVFRMPEGLAPRVRLHTALIRDEDKMDNFRVKATDSIEAMVDVTKEELGAEPISDAIYACFLDSRPILNADRITHMDMWVSYLGYLFDMNFPESFAFLTKEDYINRIIDRVPYSNPQTAARMEQIRRHALSFIAG